MFRRIVLKQGIREQGSHPLYVYVWSTKGTDGERVRLFVLFVVIHSRTHNEPTIAKGMMRVGRSMTAGLSCSLADLESS